MLNEDPLLMIPFTSIFPLLLSSGILHQTSCAYTPQQNGGGRA